MALFFQLMKVCSFAKPAVKRIASGSGGSEFLDGDLFFRAVPIFEFVAVFSAARRIQFVGTVADLVFEFEVLGFVYCGWWFFGGLEFTGNTPSGNRTPLDRMGSIAGDWCMRRVLGLVRN